MLLSLGVRAVLNCAPSGIRGLPIGAYQSHRIEYSFTNVAQDDFSYPILHRPDGTRSGHLDKACAFYDRARRAGGTMLFFCVAGQNRSATLAVAVQLVKLRIPLQQASATRVRAVARADRRARASGARRVRELAPVHSRECWVPAPAHRARGQGRLVAALAPRRGRVAVRLI